MSSMPPIYIGNWEVGLTKRRFLLATLLLMLSACASGSGPTEVRLDNLTLAFSSDACQRIRAMASVLCGDRSSAQCVRIRLNDSCFNRPR